ncbi:M28 family metallopeptidase [Flexithrix dorotheae]|uniref:M28 family metallopeptidase n=1 Tax=Flexithrix dorotheae TaxID=70993 RepID=UPI000382C013|nr:M28 family metallopeptidase [Flexithrix dorotheae]
MQLNKLYTALFHCFLLIGLVQFGCQDKPEEKDADPQIDSALVANTIKTLSDDSFEGRMPFTPGGKKAISYLETTFKEIGLSPGNGDSYLQEVPMVEITSMPDEKMKISGKNGNFELTYLDEYVAGTERPVEEINIENSELVFAGFGIVAPEYNWNDYEGLDVKGKTVIVLVNDPGFGMGDTTFFKGNTMTYYGRWTYKYEEAARQGAEGVLIVHDTRPASYPWAVVRNGFSGAQLHLIAPEGTYKCGFQGWIGLEQAMELTKAAGIESFMAEAKKEDFKPIPMGMSVSFKMKNKLQKNSSNNVVGMLPGTDKKDEYIIYSAHWDHLGIGAPVDGDSIMNGAVDNASGTGALVGIAKAFKDLPNPASRSIVFIALTAEEQGLLGSAYYAENPIFPPKQTVANINMDAMNHLGRMKDFTIIGYGQSELEDVAEEFAKKQGRYIVPDEHPGAGYFFRSDHFNFAKIGIPALYGKGGLDHIEKGKEWGEAQYQEHRAKNYHRPSDEFTMDVWDNSGIMEDTQLLFEVGLKIANDGSYPKWKEGSEFKAIREGE